MLLRRYHDKKAKEEELRDDTVKRLAKAGELLLEDFTVKELREYAKEMEVEGYYDMKKQELIDAIEGE